MSPRIDAIVGKPASTVHSKFESCVSPLLPFSSKNPPAGPILILRN